MADIIKFQRPEPAAPAPAPQRSKRRAWRHPTPEYVRADGAYEESLTGANAYTNYLKLHGRYPSPQQATAMGKRLGRRLLADDGKHYPPKTKAEIQHAREVRARRGEYEKLLNDTFRTVGSLSSLAGNFDRSDERIQQVIDYIVAHPGFGDANDVETNLEKAQVWLQRFAAAWRARFPVKQDL